MKEAIVFENSADEKRWHEIQKKKDAEFEAYLQKCRERGIDVDNEDGLLDGEEIDDSDFQGYDNTPITDEDFYRAFGMKKEDAGKGLLP